MSNCYNGYMVNNNNNNFFTCKDSIKLITGDCDDEHAEEKGLHDQHHGVQNPGLSDMHLLKIYFHEELPPSSMLLIPSTS